jgi:serine/threonine protein kinase
MPTTPEPNGRSSAAKKAAPVPSSSGAPGDAPRPGSTGSHIPTNAPSDVVRVGGSSAKRSAESDIAQFLAHPNAAGNTDDAPTVITKNQSGGLVHTPPPVPLPVVVTGEVPSIAGRKLGHFELIEAVGAGGMAAVLKARDTELSRIVALKILPPEAARDPESVTRFKQEARAAAALDHENIARVYFCGEDQGLHFIAFEFVEGINLRQMIDRRGVLPAAECVRYMIQVAAGLNHAAERGVVHRDIKPSNILITPDGRAKIVDMGLARHLGSEAVNGGVTQSGVTLGTFDYISPEQALDPRRADVRSDIYSLGCAFYHALTGRPPVPEGTAARKLRAHQFDEPLDPRVLNPQVPDEVVAVLARMMAKEPADRFQTPTELIAHLKGLAERLKLREVLATDPATRDVPAELHLLPEAPRLSPWWTAAVGAVILAAVAFVVATRDPAPTPGLPASEQARHKPAEPLPKDPAAPAVPQSPAAAPAGVVRDVAQLVKRLEDPGTTKITLGPGVFDLTGLEKPLAFNGERLELVGAVGGATRVILPAAEGAAAGTLTLKAVGTVGIRNVWFDLKPDLDLGADVSKLALAGLRLDAAQVELTDCVFAAAGDGLKSHDPRAVKVTSAGRVLVSRCLFAPTSAGGVALAVPGGARVSVSDSGFAPHSAALAVEAADGNPLTEVGFDHCTLMLSPGCAAVETAAPAHLLVKASGCVFAPVNGGAARPAASTSDAARRGVVARVIGDSPAGVRFEAPGGRASAYYEVDPLGTLAKTYTFEDCKAQALAVEAKGHVELKQRPWSDADPLKAAGELVPWKAFRLRVADDAALFTAGERGWVPMGAVFLDAVDGRLRRAYPDLFERGLWPPPRPAAVGERRTLVWFPDAKPEDLAPGVESNLTKLLADVRPDDVVLIRHTGELPRDTIELKSSRKPNEGEFKVTFRAAEGSHPVFTIDPDGEADQTMFRLVRGEVTFEGVHFRLKPDLPKNNQRAVAVGIVNGRACTFRNCLFTLAEEDDAPAAAVHLPNIDADAAMMAPANRPRPTVTFDRCVLRGRGRGVWVAASRPLNLAVTDSLTALDGPVLLTEAGGKMSGSLTSEAKLTGTTVLAGGPVVEMRGAKTVDAMRAAGLVKLDVEADRCLFVAVPGAGRPLVELEGVDPAEWKSVLGWQAKEPNRFANFDSGAVLAAIKPGGDGLPKEWLRDDWVAHTGEPAGADKRFGQVTFAAAVGGLKDLAALKPADAVVKAVDFPDLSGPKELAVGAAPDKLPAVVEEPKPEKDE